MIYAGFFRRAVALIIDVIIVMIPVLFIFGPMLAVQVVPLSDNTGNISATQASLLGATILSWQIVSLLIMWLYFAFFESSTKQATWGKQLLGIKVVGPQGMRLSFARATGRFFAKILSYLIFYIGFIMAAFTNRKRALHDFVAETYVVKTTYEEGQELPETPRHTLWLILVSVVWVLILLGGLFLSSQISLSPTEQAAQMASERMEQLAQNGTRLTQPMRLEGMTLFYTPDGYRAVVIDPVSNNKFTLFLQNGTNQTCCLAFPFGDCETTGLKACK
ncbi:MAG: RDD family protein [Elusimicrobiaceae bacterium]|nr:RDD family protein [Elusimicrobiaceae bacterium]